MPVIGRSVLVARSAAEVFDFFVHAENLHGSDSSMLECVQVDPGPVQVGTRYRGAGKILGHHIEWTTGVVDFVPGVRSESKAIEGTLWFTVSYEVATIRGGTEPGYRIAADSGLGGAFGPAMEPIVQKAHTEVVRADLDALVRLAEQRAA